MIQVVGCGSRVVGRGAYTSIPQYASITHIIWLWLVVCGLWFVGARWDNTTIPHATHQTPYKTLLVLVLSQGKKL